ncbi:hypothetical protein DENIS_1640 [Desulfonema ishimotonii]|uniref:Uncharacterized protein n=1 Tax=Desulfonema ishimotonii TaxID=45657 RepID=A0A401FUP9_9BACT|nr:hypothetical protein [Desulfonema ishimotonii]GBC60683.1 hypothetical protein DENIS_1640 [Desulfonema ishimotonii]
MKPEQIYHELRDLAEKLGIRVIEKSFRNTGINVQSGLCKVRGEHLYIMDRNIPILKKYRLLAESLARMPHEEIYVVPVIREILTRNK